MTKENKQRKTDQNGVPQKKDMLKIMSTQMYSPIRDVCDGIILTKDGRYVKIMEFTPVNLALRSGSERDIIISSFAAALKVMPETVQFKVVTRKADTNKFLSQIVQDLEGETCKGVINLAAERADLIGEISERGGVTRRFFLAFEYRSDRRLGDKKPKWSDIRSELHYQAAIIENAMNECGNMLVNRDPDDEWTMEVFYSLFCRAESEQKPFKERMQEVFARYAKLQVSSNAEYIPINNFICPQQINTQASYRYMVVDGTYYSFLYVDGQSYDVRAVAGWARTFIDMGEGIDTDIFIHKESDSATQQKLQYRIRWNKLKLRDVDDTSMDFDELSNAVNAGYYLRQGMTDGEEFCYFGVLLTVTAPSLDALDRKVNSVRSHLKKQSLNLRPCWFQMSEAFQMALPICKPHDGIFRKARRNALTSSLASIYPYITSELTDEDGIFFGRNRQSDSVVSVNNFDTSKYENANLTILGMTGAGKTFTLLNMLMRYRAKGIQVYAIIPKKGDEFLRAVEYNGGQYINLSPGSIHNINILDIRKLDNTTRQLLDGDTAIKRSRREAKIDQVRTFFQLILNDITQEELETADEALKNTYARFGITEDNDSLWDPDNPGEFKRMPLLGDLYEELLKMGPDGSRVAKVMRRYVSGSAKSFNRPTNVNLDSKMIVFDLNDLTDEMRPLGIFIALDYIWDKIREDKTVRKVVALDEVWTLLRGGAAKSSGEFLMEIIKTIRAFGGAAVTASQDLRDFFAYKDGEYGKAIISGSRTKFIMKMDENEADFVAETLHLTKSESDQIRKFHRGEGLLIAHKDHVVVDFLATPTEFQLCDTNRTTLAERRDEIARQRAQEAEEEDEEE
ncbi:PrgI family protein [Agathobaculum butyriciproducens]|nr:PrgI family protein [Agathobaculum butyriciproducens]